MGNYLNINLLFKVVKILGMIKTCTFLTLTIDYQNDFFRRPNEQTRNFFLNNNKILNIIKLFE